MREKKIAEVVSAVGGIIEGLAFMQDFPEFSYMPHEVLAWLEADLDYLEALTPVNGGWRW